MAKVDAEKLKKIMRERDEDNGGEPLNAVDRGYHLACEHLYEEIDNLVNEQEPSEDCISRKAVLDATVKKNNVWNAITNASGENLEEIINSIPSVTPTQKTVSVTSAWIPVSSGKFPPSFEACEVTVVRKDKRWNQKPYIRLAEWNDELKDWFIIPYSIMRLHGERLSESDGGDATVIAWRHLTEPYKEMTK